MASRQTVPARSPNFYPDPWAQRPDPPPVDRLVLATFRADQLAALLATRLEDLSAHDTDDDLPEATRLELGALGLCAIQIRHLLADVTQHAGAYLWSEPSDPPRREA
jgi:hypothetical protein